MADGNVEATATSLENRPEEDQDEKVIQVSYGQEDLLVSRRAKQSMRFAIDAMTNQPTIFFRCRYAVEAVCDILGKNVADYSFTQSQEDLHSFDWKSVEPGVKETYPEGKRPTDAEFEKVRSVYELVKEEKDAEARALGRPKSGVQSYITFKQRWKQWRDLSSVYMHMNPVLNHSVILDLMAAELKLCKSMGEIEEVVKLAVKKYIAKVKRDAKKAQDRATVYTRLAEVQAESVEAKAALADAQTELDLIVQEKEEVIQASQAQSEGRTRLNRAAKRKVREDAIAEVEDREREFAEELEAAQQRERELLEEEKQLRERQAEVERVEVSVPAKKKTKRSDTALLDEEPSPRTKAEKRGDAWKPPTRLATKAVKFSAPGEKWKRESVEKVCLLNTLAQHLRAAGMLEQPIAFRTVMDFVGIDERKEEYDFNARVFIHLVALVLYEDL